MTTREINGRNAQPVYLDHHATTPCRPEVVSAMLPYFGEIFGNPASVHHQHGRRAATALEEARTVVAAFFQARPNEVYFTGGATESNNIVLLDPAYDEQRQQVRVVSTQVEHKSVLAPLDRLRRRGADVALLRPDSQGFITVEQVRDAIARPTRLVSVIAANGEIGTVQPVGEIAAMCREQRVAFHTDATQAVGKVGLDWSEVDFISISAHKFYGPKGIGALIARRGTRPAAAIVGGGQERGVRAGTVNVAGAVGMAAALELRRSEAREESVRLIELRNVLWDRLIAEVPGVAVHGPRELRLPGNLNVTFRGVDAEALLLAMRRFSLSSGSACSSGEKDPSHVLLAIGVSEEDAMSSIRFGLGHSTTREDIEVLLADLAQSVSNIRQITPKR